MGRGENVRDWLYVEDHCRAIDLIIHAALADPKIIGQTFCVGGDSQKTNLQVTTSLLKLFGKDRSWIQPISHRLGHDAKYAIDSSKIKTRLSWSPRVTFAAGLAQTVAWYRQNVSWWKPLTNGRPNIDPRNQTKLAVNSLE